MIKVLIEYVSDKEKTAPPQPSVVYVVVRNEQVGLRSDIGLRDGEGTEQTIRLDQSGRIYLEIRG